jgi:hypothetical protein
LLLCGYKLGRESLGACRGLQGLKVLGGYAEAWKCLRGVCLRVFIFSLDLFAGVLGIDLRLKFGRITLVIK